MRLWQFIGGGIVAGDGVLDAAVIEVEEDRIVSIAPAENEAARHVETVDLDGGWLMPGFVDTQVNGGGGVLFNDDTDVEGIRAIGAAHARFGTTAFLPTLISEEPARIAVALDAVDAAIDAGVPGVVGVHIEGPILNAARKGIHDPNKFRLLDPAILALLTRPRRGKVMITLAPELVDTADLSALVAAGVIVSAGHSEADYDTAKAAFDAGLSGITHLFNAMPPMYQREPGLVGAALDDPRPWCGLIVDRVHVAAPVLRLALKARPRERMMLVTDAMPSVGAVEKGFTLQGRRIDVADGICTYADGTLAGSDLDMARAVANCVEDLGVTPADAAMMAATSPSDFLGLSGVRGALAPGLRADWVQLDRDLKAVATWIGGARFIPA